jgi:hypothetical protein
MRVDRERRSVAIHVVNWNLGGPDTERAETYANVTVTLLHPERWGACSKAVWLEPGAVPVALTSERHADGLRITLPRVATWGLLHVMP